MRAYFFVMVGCLILGVLTMFGYVLFGEQRSSDAGKPVVVDEPAGTKAELMITCEPGAIQMDIDCDGVGDTIDNCPYVANAAVPGLGQPDCDHDGVGDACDLCAAAGTIEERGCPTDATSRADNWCDKNPELCSQVIAGISAGFAVEIARGNLLGL